MQEAGGMRTRLATTILACISFALNWFYHRYAYLRLNNVIRFSRTLVNVYNRGDQIPLLVI